MEVKPGYKQTEVGNIPEEWGVKRLGELGEVVRGGSPRPAGDSRYFNGEFIPWLTVSALTNISECALDVTETVGFLTEEGSKYSRTLPADTLIIANSGATLGIAKILGITCCANDGIAAIVNQRSGNKAYICHYINTRTRTLREVVATGNGQPNLNTGLIRDIAIPFPPLPEQRAIAAALSDVDALLAGLDRLISKKRDLKQAAMQQLLTGQTRLPGFSGAWEVKHLGEIGEISSAGVDKKLRRDEAPVRLVNYLDVYHKDFIYSRDLNHWVTAPTHQLRRCAVKKGDVFFTPTSETRNDIGLSAVAMEDIADAAYSYHVARLRLHEPWDLRFRTYAFKTKEFLDQAETLCDGNGTRYVISQGKFRSMIVNIPPIAEQAAIAAVLSDMDAELAALKGRRVKTRDLKQAMMQELLTGKTRLVEPEAARA